MPRLVECVPNVSEGRRGDVVDRMADAIRSSEGVRLLDQTSDVDHNRSVFTYAGEPEPVLAATHALVDVVYREVDMRTHKGEHPRLGAVDVVPFVPLAGVTMDECIALAHRFGSEVAQRHSVPVFYYAKAATRPERVRLPDIRKPEYEGLAGLLETTHVPDVGPRRLHDTAGAIVVGARPFLIAFNIELDTTELKLAQQIAKEIRESSGGLPAIQAKGFMLTDPPRAQVSMNVLDFTVTSLARVWREVESRASAAGINVLRGELIGLIPLDAALQVAADALKLEGFTRDRVIETRFLE
ncbi:MAG: glutamate formimidoyltransferase [Chloroflexi bacterium]|nr:MAG: glutamate formimidoyltransferase [Chloroflexota bacterium]TMG69214.1 MAG: glutamate formimidoyltransferase [Chloroflexota bacterium]